MATYDLIFNVAKGRIGELATLPGASDSFVAIPLLAANIVNAATMRDYDTVADILAGASDEHTVMGRKTLTGVTTTVNDTTDKRVVDCDDITWTSVAVGGASAALVIAYQPSTGAADSALVPLLCMDLVATPNGGDITYQVNAAGLADFA